MSRRSFWPALRSLLSRRGRKRQPEKIAGGRGDARHKAATSSDILARQRTRPDAATPVVPDEALPGARISVVIPNYNYARYLPERIASIAAQTWRPTEIVFLDDASTDESLAVAEPLLRETGIPFRIVRNEAGRGTYRQWLAGIAAAEGDFIWIAEADDSADPHLMRSLLAGMRDPAVALAYAQSRRIDENGAVTAQRNLRFTGGISRTKWLADYVNIGLREVVDVLAYRNTIPNVSACLLRKDALAGIEQELAGFRYCGDWLLYAHVLKGRKIAFVSGSLNIYRRHSGSVTHTQRRTVAYLEELVGVRALICRNYPIHPSQLPRMDRLLDRDYKIDAIARNSTDPSVRPRLDALAARVAANRRIALITSNKASTTGGSEMLWREAAFRLREKGHDVVVLIKNWQPRPAFFDDLESAGIKIYFRESDGIAAIAAFRPDLAIVSIGGQDEIINFHKELIAAGISYAIVNQLTKEERVWPVRAERAGEVTTAYLSAAKVFFTSANNHRVMEERLRGPVPNWAIHYNPYHIDRNLVPPFPSTGGPLSLAVPAQILFAHKGQDLLVEVLKAGKWKARNLVFNIYGEGRDADRLVQMAEERGVTCLVFHGRVADIGTIWRDNHAIVMPSRMEGLPIMLVSALLSARVPIVTDVGGHAEVIDDGVSGFLAANPTVEDLDDAMERAFAARESWEEIGRRGRERILAFLPEDPVEDFVDRVLALAPAPMVGARGREAEGSPTG